MWSGDKCETRVAEADMMVNCTCNMMAGRKLGLIKDSALEEIPWHFSSYFGHQDESEEYTLMAAFLVLVILALHFLLIVGQCAAWKLDIQDQKLRDSSSSSNEV